MKKRKIEVNEDNLLDVSERITDNSDSIKKILDGKKCPRRQRPMDLVRSKRLIGINPKQRTVLVDDQVAKSPSIDPASQDPSYLSQFDVQMFDAEEFPGAFNDIYQTRNKGTLADLERKLSYDGGWTPYAQDNGMTYGVLKVEDMENNMVPYFKTKNGYGSNDMLHTSYMDQKNELFTGNLKSTWNKKEEIRPHFKPMANMSHSWGTPIVDERDRCMPSMFRQNEKLFDSVKDTPGLNLGYDEDGLDGFHPTYRVLDKTVDELRVRPKITFEGRVIDGMKGQKRPIQAPVHTYKPDTYKVTDPYDMVPTNGSNDGPRSRENFIMKETDRANQHIEYTGAAYSSQDAIGRNVPEYMREKYKYSTRQNFTMPIPLQRFSKSQEVWNPNIGSYQLAPTARDQSIHNNYIGPSSAMGGSTTHLMDAARPTTKQTLVGLTTPAANIGPSTMRGTAHPMSVPDTTIKEISIENRLNPHVSMDTAQRVYFSDVARPTTKESTLDQIMPSNISQNKIYCQMNDWARPTTKETTVDIPYGPIVSATNHQYRTNLQDLPRPTTKETTIGIPYQTNLTPNYQQQRAPNPTDLARQTMKETTVGIPFGPTPTPMNYQRTPHPQDLARETTKETTVQTPWSTFLSPGQTQGTAHPLDIPRQTTKETTVQTPWSTFVSDTRHGQQTPHLQDLMKTTTKEMTVGVPNQLFVEAVNQQGPSHLQDVARHTMKEHSVQIPHQLFVQGGTHCAAPLQDIAKQTMKETTVGIPRASILDPNVYRGMAPSQDVARTTMREALVQIPFNSNVMGGSGINAMDRSPLRTTTKEQTAVLPQNHHLTGAAYRPVAGMQDQAKPTLKECTIQIPYNTNITSVDSRPRAGLQDQARPTTREQTVQIPYNMHLRSDEMVGPASTFNRTPLKMTTKETTIDHEHGPNPTLDTMGHGYGYLSTKMHAPTTNRQFTCEEVYVAPLLGDLKPRSYLDAYNARVDDRKDLLHFYRTPTNSNINMGPDPDKIKIRLREDDRPTHSLGPIYSVNNHLDRLQPQTLFKNSNPNASDRFIDPSLLKQLESNPYNISITTS